MAMTSPNSYDNINMPSTSYLQREEVVVVAGDNPYYYDSSNEQSIIPRYRDEGEQKKVVGKVDKIVNRIVDKYEKHIPASIRDQINLEEFMAKDRNRGPTSRGLDEKPFEQDKIQRFKIRTVVAQDVDKEDHDHTKN
ncbi:hypothetical protein PIB30_042448 [Stylosanthes scabra]|uniref:Uncharacterized protein n=1 Tax=Stylosanthes scabra TaxID=79078 RepID=A0ABU6TEV7_9FABA|nr:hypothetical protein [Stylosanthes scabra]